MRKCSKIIEVVIFNRIGTFLQSSPNQFGFKPKHGTELCVFAFKELLRIYQKHGSAMHVAFLDASKAFDRVNRRKLLLKLESRGVPTYILRLLSNELIGQYMCSLGFHSLRIFPHWEWSEARGDIVTLTF